MTVLLVDFLADGRCTVHAGRGVLSIDGAGPHEQAIPRTGESQVLGGDFRCPIPYRSIEGGPVELRVVLPSGVAPADRAFPRLDWQQSGHDWIGTATLPAAPSFVSLGPGAAPFEHAGFGGNFYGFFVFAAVFIAVYFAWARWMQHRTAAPAR